METDTSAQEMYLQTVLAQ